MYVIDGIAYAGEQQKSIAVKSARPLNDHRVLVSFSNGERRVFDFVQPLYLASQLPDILSQAHCVFGRLLLNVQVAVLCRMHPFVQRSVRYLQFLAGSLYPYFQRQLY